MSTAHKAQWPREAGLWGFAAISVLMAIWCSTDVKAGEEPVLKQNLIVGTKEAPPFSMKTEKGDWEGISIDLWREIAAGLGVSFEFRELSLMELIEGTANRSLDAAVAAITVTPERERILDFTHPYHTTGLGIAIPSKEGGSWSAVLSRLFSLRFLKVVSGLVLALLGVGMLVSWCERRKNPGQFGGGTLRGIAAGLWWSAVTLTTVGYGDKVPRSVGGRLLAVVWMFGGIVIISSFTAAVTSALTVSALESRVKGPEDLPNVRVGAVSKTISASYLQDNHISFLSYNLPLEGLRAIQKGEIDAFVHDAPILRYLIKKEFQGILQVLPGTFVREDYGIALPPESPLREPINRVLLARIRESGWQDILDRHMN